MITYRLPLIVPAGGPASGGKLLPPRLRGDRGGVQGCEGIPAFSERSATVATILSMPKWGLAMKTGRVVEWRKQPGAPVQQGEPIVQIESEKATNEVEAPGSGTVRWLGVPEGESAPVGAPLAVIAAPGEELSDEQVETLLREEAEAKRRAAEQAARRQTAPKAPASGGAARAKAAPTAGVGAAREGRVNASPAARRLAQELGVDLVTVAGTGPGGMIGREDVLRAAEAAKAAPEAEEGEERVVDVGGIATHCLIAGPAGAPHVIFVHGLGGAIATWALNLEAFAERFRICALDLPGAGASDKPAMDYSVPALADFLARFLDTLGPDWQRVSIVGHSLGGAVALAFAERYPDRVARLVLVDSAGLGAEIDGTLLSLVQAEPTREHLRAELACFFAQPGMVQEALVDQLYEQRRLPGAREALLATTAAAFGGGSQRADLRAALASLPHPMLAVWGAADRVIPVAHAQAVNQGPHRQIEIFTDCGHAPHIERSDAFNQLALAFLSEP
jgi:pimeloyl-ACP methyl ester carboxylesterase